MDPFRVFLVRHAKAERENPGGDAARALTDGGRERFSALLAALGGRLAVSRVVTSPYVRARQTAELVASHASAPLEEDAALASGATGAGILAAAREAGPGAALVGHNPEIAEALQLAGLEGAHVPPGTIAAILVEGRRARLEWLETPRD
jgi:phosphohistidine phosphatase